ncbi:hypothetical protein [Hymenobacter norwichensis]|uniref:hypothetical protein n=1 Tax=Hymenobacter norwichensis TaxID=223903 RepID=UPI0003B75916|nr:hypothetical protein [Hymenobacter norwichensis]
MSHVLLTKLRQTLTQLKPLTTTCYTPAERQTLRAQLATTITNLRTLYPDDLSSDQKYRLLQNLTLLEQQAQSLSEPTSTDTTGCAQWRALTAALRAAIEDALTDYSIAHPEA